MANGILAVSVLAIPVDAWSLLVRFVRARGVERQQLRWLALAAALVAAGAVVITALLAMGLDAPVGWVYGACLAMLPLATAAAVLRYRLYDFQPARRRIQAAVDRRFNRGRYNAAKTVETFSVRLRNEVDLDTLAAELLAVIDQTMQPTRTWLWLRAPDSRHTAQ